MALFVIYTLMDSETLFFAHPSLLGSRGHRAATTTVQQPWHREG